MNDQGCVLLPSDLEAEQETAEVSPQQEATTANKGEEAPSIPEEVAKDTPSEEVPASEPILQPAPETESVQCDPMVGRLFKELSGCVTDGDPRSLLFGSSR